MSADAASLASQLASPRPEDRLAAVERLATLGPAAAPASTALVVACGDPELGDLCVGALEELGPPPADQLEALAGLARSDHELVAYWATTLLGRSGPAAEPHIPTIRVVAERAPSKAVRDRAAWALGRIGSPAES